MKPFYQTLAALCLTLCCSVNLKAFEYRINEHTQVIYDTCGRDLVVTFVYHQSEGDDDRMLWLKLWYLAGSGNNQVLFDFRHLNHWPDDPLVGATLDTVPILNGIGDSYAYQFPAGAFNFDVAYVTAWHDLVLDEQGAIKYYIQFRLRSLPQIPSISVFFDGTWGGEGSGSPDLVLDQSNSLRTINIATPSAPEGFTASQNACGQVNMNWTYDEGFATCPEKEYRFLIYKDNFNDPYAFVGLVQVLNPELTNFSFSYPILPTSTNIESHPYKVRLALVDLNTLEHVQLSPLSVQANGYPQPLPMPPTNLSVNYPNCSGQIQLQWSNPHLYDSVIVAITQIGIGTTLYRIDGSPTSWNGTISPASGYSAVVYGIDFCHQSAASGVLTPIMVPALPTAPASLTIVNSSGGNYLDWSPGNAAESYKITRLGGEATVEFNINDPNQTDYLDLEALVCVSYSYKVTTINQCGSASTGLVNAPVITPAVSIWTNQKMIASKGYHEGHVKLEWGAPNNLAFDYFKVWRKSLGSADAYTFVGSVPKQDVAYNDPSAQAGILYEYQLIAYSECNGNSTQSAPLSDTGFRLPIATVAGQVTFASGTGVSDVMINVERNQGVLGKSIQLDGEGSLTFHPGYANTSIPFGDYPGQTIEMWMWPTAFNDTLWLYEYASGAYAIGLYYLPAEQNFVQYYFNQSALVAGIYHYPLSTEEFTHISSTFSGDGSALYINGQPIEQLSQPSNIAFDTHVFALGRGLTGYMDEIRYWGVVRSPEMIQSDLHCIARGDEEDLIAYWRLDEGVGTGMYDISGENENFNEHHLIKNGVATWANVFPDPNQLGNCGLTDEAGHYTVRNIRYTGVGNTFTVVPFYSPQGTPHEFDPNSTVLFLGEGNNVQNNVNFKDKSSFLVTGSVLYSLPDSMCTNNKAFLYIDGNIAVRNNQPVTADPFTGVFEMDVPIGLHRLSVAQSGHIFHHGGTWPPDGSSYDFQKDETGIEFFDSTRIRVIGRVVGGTREGDKKLGFDESINNIGVARIIFTSQLFGCHADTILTDSSSGEYAIDLLPIRYDVAIEVPSNPNIDFGALDVLDLTFVDPVKFIHDTLYNPAHQILRIDSIPYHRKLNYIYRSQPEIDVVMESDESPLHGDDVYLYKDLETDVTYEIQLNDIAFPVFLSGKQYATLISTFEPYVNYDQPLETVEDRVPVTDGKLTLRNLLGNASGIGQSFDEVFDITSTDGLTPYTFLGGQPEFLEHPNPGYSYTQTFEIYLDVAGHTTTWMPNGEVFRGYVLGGRPVEGSSFITEGPELVDYILRDPPGDASFASITTGTTHSNTKSWSTSQAINIGKTIHLKAGTSWIIGFGIPGIGFNTSVSFDNTTKINVKTGVDVNGEYVESNTYETEIRTNEDPWFPGTKSDIYMGKSRNYLFGASEEFTMLEEELCGIVPCIGPTLTIDNQAFRLGKRDGLIIVPQGFNTSFIYSQEFIINYLIPNLESVRNSFFVQESEHYQSHLTSDDEGFGLNNDDEFFGDDATGNPLSTEEADFIGPSYTYTYPAGEAPNDQIRWYNQQIRIWREAIARNEKEKALAELERNISFDANASITNTVSSESTDTYTESFEVNLTVEAEIAIGAIIAGSGGVFNFTLGLEQTTGGAFSQTTTHTNTYSYTLADASPGDFFSIDVKKSTLGNSPIFSLRGGQSMCPWEQRDTTMFYAPGTALGESTIRRELPSIEVENSFANNVPSHQPARFKLHLRNESPTGDIQWYGLKVLEQTNPHGAILLMDGVTPNRVFEVPAGETVIKTLELYKADSNFYEIKLILYSPCEYDAFSNTSLIFAVDTVTITAQFIPACGPVSIRMPDDLWVNNVDNNNEVEIQLDEYDIDDPVLENIRLQYKPSFTSTWKGIETLWKVVPNGLDDPQIPPGSSIMSFLWNIEELPDGPYDIRAVTHCTNTNNDYASPVVSGIVDRIRPHAFGNPQPADGVLDPNDELLIQFNEVINPASVSTLDFDVRAVLNGSPLRHETSVQFDGINDYIQIPAGTRIDDNAFTWEVWMKRTLNGAQLLWSQGEKADSSMSIGFNASNVLYFKWDNTTINSTATITADNQWHHLVVTCNADKQVRFYHTGLPAGSGTVAELVSIPGNMVYGKAAWAESGYFDGYMHDARIWKTELTEGNIQSQMLKRLSGAEPGLSMLWPMDEGTGTILHEIVRKKNAHLFGTWSVLPSGYSMSFGGTFHVEADAGDMVFTKQHSFTLEFWMKGSKTAATQTILSNGKGDGTDANEAGWSISATSAGKLIIEHGSQLFTVIEKDVLNDNWHHIAIVLNRQGNLNVFMNGLLQNSVYADAFGEFAGPALWIGQRGWYNGAVEMHDRSFTGLLDEIRVWNTKLTAEHIRVSMNNRLIGDEFGLQLYLPFESYAEVGGIPVLTQTFNDQSALLRTITLGALPSYQSADPNIKLTAPFEKVNFTFSINEDKILITPTTDPLRLERTVLFISLNTIEDRYGNELAGPINWTAFVNKNQLQWSTDELAIEKPEQETYPFTADIVNSGGIDLSYEILGLPEWLTANPSVGTISAVSSKTIQFEISPEVKIGDYSTDINLVSGTGYNDKLALDLHVFGVPPSWQFDPNAFAHSMLFIGELEIKSELSENELDQVVAYVNGDVRGLATIEYVPGLDKYFAFMTVYSNVTSGENITFKVWEAKTGFEYAGVNFKVNNTTSSSYAFTANGLAGNTNSPARWIVTGDVIQEIPLNAGWTWISFNVLSPNFNNVNTLLSELTFENNDVVQTLVGNQIKSVTYNPSSGWQGNLPTPLDVKKMYQCDFTYQDVLRVSGPRVNPTLYPITISNGINWLPMLSSEKVEVNQALSSFNAVTGDWVKSQNQLAVYHAAQGWVGTLKYMEPGKGYLLYSSHTGSIIYPFAAKPDDHGTGIQNQLEHAIKWRSGHDEKEINPQERNMTMVIRLNSEVDIEGIPVIAAFASGQLLQLAEGIPLLNDGDRYYYFTLQGHEGLGSVYFEVYDANADYIGLADERIRWTSDQMIGSHAEPFILHLTYTEDLSMEVFPNPFEDEVNLTLEVREAGRAQMSVYDVDGKLIFHSHYFFPGPGLQFLSWNGRGQSGDELPSGLYVIELMCQQRVHREKIVRL